MHIIELDEAGWATEESREPRIAEEIEPLAAGSVVGGDGGSEHEEEGAKKPRKGWSEESRARLSERMRAAHAAKPNWKDGGSAQTRQRRHREAGRPATVRGLKPNSRATAAAAREARLGVGEVDPVAERYVRTQTRIIELHEAIEGVAGEMAALERRHAREKIALLRRETELRLEMLALIEEHAGEEYLVPTRLPKVEEGACSEHTSLR